MPRKPVRDRLGDGHEGCVHEEIQRGDDISDRFQDSLHGQSSRTLQTPSIRMVSPAWDAEPYLTASSQLAPRNLPTAVEVTSCFEKVVFLQGQEALFDIQSAAAMSSSDGTNETSDAARR